MKKTLLVSLTAFALAVFPAGAQGYTSNRAPLVGSGFMELPLGAVKADGWLHQQLVLQKDGLTGHLDEYYPSVVGARNAWLGGDGDAWERGPYWIDGLLPLAYILDDNDLQKKVSTWVEWTLASQDDSGFFGPSTFYFCRMVKIRISNNIKN